MPSVEKLEKLSDFFEVSIDYLLGRDHEYEAKGRIIVCPPPESIAESEEELRAIQKRIKDIMLYNIARMEYKKRKREREREKAIKRGTSTKAKKR
jgi:hypothetical protein